MQGQIIKIISNDFTVLCNDNVERTCKARGKFRNMKIIPLVGDHVIVDTDINCIMEVLPRKNSLVRPAICNIDRVFIIAATTKPEFDSNLLDKLLVISEFNQIEPIICLTKVDLLTEEKFEELKPTIEYYQKIGYEVVINTELDRIKELLSGKVTVFTGQSGAGKSTLLNTIDDKFNIRTNEISIALGRGKHTTRHTELLKTCEGWVADTPGFSSLEFDMVGMTKSDIRDNFVEFQELRDECKYKDCMHFHDDGCKIKEEVKNGNIIESRYKNYIKFITGKE